MLHGNRVSVVFAYGASVMHVILATRVPGSPVPSGPLGQCKRPANRAVGKEEVCTASRLPE